MEASGIIFALLDCDDDAVADWNRWYDLEHLPPNVALPGVLSGQRYQRIDGEAGEGRFLTIYLLQGDVEAAMAEMTELRTGLDHAGRMFPAEKKHVRFGDALGLSWALGRPAIKAEPRDVPFLGHAYLQVVQRRVTADDPEPAARHHREAAIVAVDQPSVVGALSFHSRFQPGLHVDLYLLESSDPVSPALTDGEELVLDTVFDPIVPLRTPW